MLYLKNKPQSSLDNFKRFNASDWDEFKKHITYKLVNKKVFHADENNENVIYDDCLDLSKVYMVTELSEDRKSIKSYPIKEEDLERFNKSIDDIVVACKENFNKDKHRRIRTMKEDILSRETLYPLMANKENAMLNGANGFIEDKSESHDNVLIVTNKFNVFGASYMFDRNTLKTVYERMNGDFYILPLSADSIMCVNAKYIMRDKDMYEAEDDLLDMLFNMNEQVKEPSNILSYKIYKYIKDDGEVLVPIKQQL